MRRRKILVFQHVPFEPLGTLDPVLRKAGFRIRYVNFGREPQARPSLDGYVGIIALGGPMNVDEVAAHPHLATEVELLREANERGMQVLGICLGAQLLARALGGDVERAPRKEIGWYDLALTEAGERDEVLGEFAPVQRIFQWHGDRFTLPPGAVSLAGSERARHQAFRYGDHAYGFQFHLEVNGRLIERWLSLPFYAEELRALEGEIDPDAIRAETRERIGMLKDLSRRTFGKWIARFGIAPRRRLLRSR